MAGLGPKTGSCAGRQTDGGHKYSTRFLSIKLLENDPDIERIVRTLPNADEIFHVRDKMSKRVDRKSTRLNSSHRL